jgi:hypothetical protein
VRTNIKTVFVLNCFLDIFDQTSIKVNTSAAVITKKMMMVLAWFYYLIATFLVAEIHSLNKSELNQ